MGDPSREREASLLFLSLGAGESANERVGGECNSEAAGEALKRETKKASRYLSVVSYIYSERVELPGLNVCYCFHKTPCSRLLFPVSRLVQREYAVFPSLFFR